MVRTKKNYWQGRRVLVTGHEGFLGSWLAKTLIENGAQVLGLDKDKPKSISILNSHRRGMKSIHGNIENFKLVQTTISRFKPQTIFHIAAEAIVNKANKNPRRAFKSNIEGTWNILEAVRGKDFVEAVVAASSDKAYGSHESLPYEEKAALQGEHPYDVSKSCADLLCRSYFKTFKVPVCVTRCGNIYGPGDLHFSRLIPDAIRCVLKGKQFAIRSDGKFTRDYIFVKDVVEAYLSLAQKMKPKGLYGEAFNFSYEKPLTVLEVFNQIAEFSSPQRIAPRILNQASFEIRHQYLSSRKARKLLGWRAKYSLKEGLQETVAWYKVYLK